MLGVCCYRRPPLFAGAYGPTCMHLLPWSTAAHATGVAEASGSASGALPLCLSARLPMHACVRPCMHARAAGQTWAWREKTSA